MYRIGLEQINSRGTVKKLISYYLVTNTFLILLINLAYLLMDICWNKLNTLSFLVFLLMQSLLGKNIEYIAMKISKGLGALGRVRNILPQNALLMLYNTMVYPYLTYCNIVWGTASASTLQRLVVLQNRAVRLVTRSTFRSSCHPLFVCLNILKLSDINKFQIALFMYKMKHHLLPLSCL